MGQSLQPGHHPPFHFCCFSPRPVVVKLRLLFFYCIAELAIFFFCCIAERAIKPCRSSRSKLRGEFGIPRHFFFFSLVSRTRHHSCAGHCSTKRSLCNFIQNATIPPGRNTQQKNTKPTATKQKTNNATPTTPKPKTKRLSGNRVAYFCTTYN